jgi:negative regulator of sigma-B (phosphoserine phosphatase)
MKLKVSEATRPKVGEQVSGDAVVVRAGEGEWLLAVIDALGHGPVAAASARAAVDYLQKVEIALDVRTLVTGLHAALRDMRGAAAMVCRLSSRPAHLELEGCGVGNVELRTTASAVPVVLSPGILGGTVRQFRVFRGQLGPQNRLAIFSDGISGRFTLDSLRQLTPAQACARLMSENGRAHDDATVVVADCENR